MGEVLVVDDDEGSRKALAEVLSDEGYQVATCADGADALEYLRGGARPGVILLDLMMPGIDGWDFRMAQKRDAALSAIPVVAISAAGKLLDAEYSLRKPVDLAELLRLLRTLM